MSFIKKKYKDTVIKNLKKAFSYKNDLEIPRLEKISLNIAFKVADADNNFLSYVNCQFFLKQHPRNTEKLKMKAYCLETLWETEEAIEIYKKILELQPYNSKVLEKLEHLEW